MITNDDVKKIRKALKPDFDSLEDKFDRKLASQTKEITTEIKKYIHEGVDAVVEGVDQLLDKYQFDKRIKRLEKIHPQGQHQALN